MAVETSNLNQIFASFEALHMSSNADMIEITQGNSRIRLPAQMVDTLIESLILAKQGEI
jgi:hypothetical protein